MYDTEGTLQALTSACYASSLVPRAFFMMDQDPSLNVAARADARGLDWDFHSTAVPYMASSG